MGTATANVTIDFDKIANDFSGTTITIPKGSISNYITYDLTDSDNGNVTSSFNANLNEWEFYFTNDGKIAFTALNKDAPSNITFNWKDFSQSGSQDLSNRTLSNNNQTVTYDVTDASGTHQLDNVDMVIEFTKEGVTYTANWDPLIQVGTDPG